MFKLFRKIFGRHDFTPLIKKINLFEPELGKLTDEELKNRSGKLKQAAAGKNNLDDFLVEAFALMREAAKRVLNQRHFDVINVLIV